MPTDRRSHEASAKSSVPMPALLASTHICHLVSTAAVRTGARMPRPILEYACGRSDLDEAVHSCSACSVHGRPGDIPNIQSRCRLPEQVLQAKCAPCIQQQDCQVCSLQHSHCQCRRTCLCYNQTPELTEEISIW